MTMKVIIVNDDQTRAALVSRDDPADPFTSQTEIPPGQHREFWIHGDVRLTLVELPEADAP